jgi:hypothetical protein
MPFWPTAVAQPSDLLIALNRYATTLAQACAPTDTTLHVANAVSVQKGMTLWIDFEEVLVLSGAVGDAITVQRGYGGSAQAAHAVSAPVSNDYSAAYHNVLSQEISALETSANQPFGFLRLDSAGHLPTLNLPANVCYLDGTNKVPLANLPVLTSAQLPTNICYLDGTNKVPVGFMPANIAYMTTSNAGTFTVTGMTSLSGNCDVRTQLRVVKDPYAVTLNFDASNRASIGLVSSDNILYVMTTESSSVQYVAPNLVVCDQSPGWTKYFRFRLAGTQPTLDFSGVTGSLTILGGLATQGGIATYPALQVAKDSSAAQKILLQFDGSNNPTITATGGDNQLHVPGALAVSGALASGTHTVNGDLVVNVASASGGTIFNLPAANNSWLVIGGSKGSMSLGSGNTINGSNPYIASFTGQLNFQFNVYVAGSVSATAHITHGSGSELADVHREYRRQETRRVNGIDETPVPAGGWGLVPHDDGLHLLVKRSKTQVSEHVIPWDQFRDISERDLKQ